MSVTRSTIHQFIRLNSLSIYKKEDCIQVHNFVKEQDLKFHVDEFKSLFSKFISEYNKRWTQSKRINKKFIRKNSAWLENDFITISKEEENNKQLGTSTVSFEDSSSKTKKRKVVYLPASNSSELLYASYMLCTT